MNNKRIEDLLVSMNIENGTLSVADDTGNWDSAALLMRANKLGAELKKRGIGHLDAVAVVCENSSSYIVAIIAVLWTGAIAVPLDPQLPYDFAKDLIKKSKAKAVCISGARPERTFANLCPDSNGYKYDLLAEGHGDWKYTGLECSLEDISCDAASDEDPAFIMFTSGTTGLPKGVVLSHKAIMKNVDAIVEYMNPSNKDSFYITKTMVHSSTLTGEVFVAMKVGAGIIAYNPVVPPSTLLKRIQLFKPSIMCVNPTILRLILKTSHVNYDLSSIRLLYTSGAVADPVTLAEAESFFPKAKILNVYGLTEAGPRLTAQRADDKFIKHGSVGRPINGVTLKILNADGNECKHEEAGIVYVKTQSIMIGYWEDSEATKKKIADGWLNTGDMGYLDNERDLFIIGRSDEMIIRGAHNVDPYRIESTIKKLKGIINCVVFGVPDKINGDRIICLFQKEADNSIERNNILDSCREALAPYEIPQEIYEVQAIPTTPGGKISRRLALEYYNTVIKTKSSITSQEGTN